MTLILSQRTGTEPVTLQARVNALRHVLHTLDYAEKDTTRIGQTDPLVVGPAASVHETGEDPGRKFPHL